MSGCDAVSDESTGVSHEHGARRMFGGGGWYQPRGPYGAYPGCGCSSIVMIMAGILLVLAGMMRGCNM